MTLTNIVCYDISIGDVDLVYVRNSNQDLDIAVDIVELDIKCELDYDYEYGLLDGSGTAKVTTDGNSMDTVLGFTSANFETHAPHASSVESCAANFEITNIEFSGDFVSNIVEVFERFIRNTIENSIEKVACDELASLGTNFVGGILQVADDTLAIYQGDLGKPIPTHCTSSKLRNFHPLWYHWICWTRKMSLVSGSIKPWRKLTIY